MILFNVIILLFALLLTANVWLVMRVMMPLQNLATRTKEISVGDLSALEKPCGGVIEIGKLNHAMASMASHVARTHHETQVYSHAVIDAQETERARLARELHDDTVQSIVATVQSLDIVAQLMRSNPEQALSFIQSTRQQGVEIIDNVRRLIADLRPPALDELGLVPALEMLHADNIELRIQTIGMVRRLPADIELALFRIAQEAVRNAGRHSNAKHIDVTIHYLSEQMLLDIEDDGNGFQLPEQITTFAQYRHYGVIGMIERAQHLNGSIKIDTKVGKGVTISVIIPLATSVQPSRSVIDPVCGAMIQPQQAYGTSDFEGETYYFCCPVCQGAFQKQPQAFLKKI